MATVKESDILRTKRGYGRQKATTAINAAKKMIKTEWSAIRIKELKIKSGIAVAVVAEVAKVHQNYIIALEREGKTPEDNQNEEESQQVHQEQYEDDLEEIEDTIAKAQVAIQCNLAHTKSNVWLKLELKDSEKGDELVESLTTLLSESIHFLMMVGLKTRSKQLRHL